ncbi:hypothetical protein [Brevundimonas subvibrioides]|uniref:hypothetical protein n=1 Tax=Brevundimonas subvibrioides TaxID=74313 RepID=UPI0022B39DE1|nr:hypothetical protein [Brevundimonas subvibrioides]
MTIPLDMILVAAVAALLTGLFVVGLTLMGLDRFGARRMAAYPGGPSAARRDVLISGSPVIVFVAATTPLQVLNDYLPDLMNGMWLGTVGLIAVGLAIWPAAQRARRRLGPLLGRAAR